MVTAKAYRGTPPRYAQLREPVELTGDLPGTYLVRRDILASQLNIDGVAFPGLSQSVPSIPANSGMDSFVHRNGAHTRYRTKK